MICEVGQTIWLVGFGKFVGWLLNIVAIPIVWGFTSLLPRRVHVVEFRSRRRCSYLTNQQGWTEPVMMNQHTDGHWLIMLGMINLGKMFREKTQHFQCKKFRNGGPFSEWRSITRVVHAPGHHTSRRGCHGGSNLLRKHSISAIYPCRSPTHLHFQHLPFRISTMDMLQSLGCQAWLIIDRSNRLNDGVADTSPA